MDFKFSENDEQFRREIRRKIAELLPADTRDRHRHIATFGSDAEDQRRWFGILDEQGWSVPGWPVAQWPYGIVPIAFDPPALAGSLRNFGRPGPNPRKTIPATTNRCFLHTMTPRRHPRPGVSASSSQSRNIDATPGPAVQPVKKCVI